MLDRHALWASDGSFCQLSVCWPGATPWRAFGGARGWWISAELPLSSSAVLWDIVVTGELLGHSVGRRVIEELLHTPPVVGVKCVYLMTTKITGFYGQLGFENATPQ